MLGLGAIEGTAVGAGMQLVADGTLDVAGSFGSTLGVGEVTVDGVATVLFSG